MKNYFTQSYLIWTQFYTHYEVLPHLLLSMTKHPHCTPHFVTIQKCPETKNAPETETPFSPKGGGWVQN